MNSVVIYDFGSNEMFVLFFPLSFQPFNPSWLWRFYFTINPSPTKTLSKTSSQSFIFHLSRHPHRSFLTNRHPQHFLLNLLSHSHVLLSHQLITFPRISWGPAWRILCSGGRLSTWGGIFLVGCCSIWVEMNPNSLSKPFNITLHTLN